MLCFFGVHKWERSQLIFDVGKISHHMVKSCRNCDKSKTIFSGSREEWLACNNFYGSKKNN
jgi:hypothetical protein